MKHLKALLYLLVLLIVSSSLTYLIFSVYRHRMPAPPTHLIEVDAAIYVHDVHRFTDLDGAVTCWVYKQGMSAAGISCIATESIQRIKE